MSGDYQIIDTNNPKIQIYCKETNIFRLHIKHYRILGLVEYY